MDAFVSRKRRRVSPPKAEPTWESADEESTDYKLSVLSSLHPEIDPTILLEALLISDGSVSAASETLRVEQSVSPRKRLAAGTGYQSSIVSSLNYRNTSKDGSITHGSGPMSKSLVKKGRTLHLYSPADIEAHTPCTLLRNFLPAAEANALLTELMAEADAGWRKATFQLFERTVQSPHSICFYVDSREEAERQRNEFRYNGGYIQDVRELTPEMRKVSTKVQAAVNQEILRHIHEKYPGGKKLRYQSPREWKPNAAFANCYDGGEENVGYHTDQLTYLGPHPTIGSLSLGVTREFRVRRIVRKGEPRSQQTGHEISIAAAEDESDASGQIAIHLPHNSLLVMHAEMQEGWKHSVAPALTITPHPLAGRKRINVTYRCYRDSLHPRFTPRCECGVPVILRSVRDGYAWMCFAGYVPGKKGCNFFRWAEFDDDGEPPWVRTVEEAGSRRARPEPPLCEEVVREKQSS